MGGDLIMLIICTTVICIAICIAVLSIIKISKTDNENIIKKNPVALILLASTYICSFISLYILLKEYNSFDIARYFGVCSYWVLAGTALFSFLNLILFSKRNKASVQESSAELVKELILMILISILWVVSNTLLDKFEYIVFSVPAVMIVLILIILVKLILKRETSDI